MTIVFFNTSSISFIGEKYKNTLIIRLHLIQDSLYSISLKGVKASPEKGYTFNPLIEGSIDSYYYQVSSTAQKWLTKEKENYLIPVIWI